MTIRLSANPNIGALVEYNEHLQTARPPRNFSPRQNYIKELKTLGMSASALALALGVPANRITSRIAAYFGGSPEYWVRLQVSHDPAKYEAENGFEVQAQVRKPMRDHSS